ncbi:MAG: cysteine-rich CWC family protein [Flavobacteriales bacterium]
MPEHEPVHCARCGTEFECKVGTVQECQCFEVPLTRRESEWIGEVYEGCLCAGCLKILQKAFREGVKVP